MLVGSAAISVKIAALGDLPAGEGFGAVLGVALNGLLALALIFVVLMILDRVHKRKDTDPEKNTEAPEEQVPQKNETLEENREEPDKFS